jgi:outer membrane protein TolC
MNESTTWPSILAAAMLLAWVTVTPCAAQSQLLPTTAPPPLESDGGQGGGQPGALPESSVSPAIERFVREHGRDLPLPPAARPAVSPGSTPIARQSTSSVPPPRVRTMTEILAARDAQASPPRPSATPPAQVNEDKIIREDIANSLKLKTAPLEPTDLAFPISLATALRLSDARPLVVAAAQARVWVAEAQLTRAKLLWVPSLMFGVDYIRHDGGAAVDVNKGLMTHASVNFFYAGPGLWQYVNLTDAIFEPLAARQVLNARHNEIQAAKNDSLLQTAAAYFQVHQYRGMYAGALYTVERGHDLIERIAQLSKEFVPTVEVERAKNLVADLEQRAVMARQEWRVQSANLSQVLRLDPRAVVVPLEHDHTQITLIDPSKTLDDLMPIALVNRPEIASRQSLVQAAELKVREEKMRPFLPVVMLNGLQSAGMYIQGGIFAIGPNGSLNQWLGRDDVSVQLGWQLENFGFGNLARIKGTRGMESRAFIDLRHAQDMVAADVTRAQARVQSAAARVAQADRALRTGIITFNGHLEGLGQTRRLENVLVLTYRPQEAVYSLDLLNVAFNEYFTTVAEYNRAQFELFHALGYPAREVALTRIPGEVVPVDTERPPYLPPVGNGPPPATR